MRSWEVQEPNTWGTWGGAIDEGENPEETVIRELNEGIGDWYNKFITYGRKGLLTAGIVLSVAFSTQAQEANKTMEIIKNGTEMTTNNEKQNIYSFMVGIATENTSLSMQNSNFEASGAFKEISKYYQQLRDGSQPQELSSNAKKYLNVITSTMNKLDNQTVYHFIQQGKQIKTID